MRIAQCIKPLKLQLLGSKTSVAISEGWQGDLDQVIGVDGNGIATTVANALGHHFTQDNFRLVPAAKPKTQE